MRFFKTTCLAILLSSSLWSQNTDTANDQPVSDQAVCLPFNSSYPEWAPVLSWDGSLLFFAKDEAPGNLGFSNRTDIWYSRRTDGLSWSPPINVGRPLNDDGHSIPMALSPLEDQLFVVRKGSDQRYTYLMSSTEGRMWQSPTGLDISWLADGSFPTSQIKSFQLSYDQQYFIFLAETPDGCGQLDIYVSVKNNDNQWAYPFNIGPIVNSDENECSLFLAADNQSLYFASNGHNGLGGYDIFVSRRQDDSWLKWSTPLNLGPAVNSPADEQTPAMSMIGDELFFSRNTPERGRDIFSYLLPPAFRPLTRHIVHGQVSKSGDQRYPLQVHAVGKASPKVMQSSKGKYIAMLPDDQASLLYQASPKNTFSESLAFFQRPFFDSTPESYRNHLLNNRSYQERETHIQQLKNTRAQLMRDLQNKEAHFKQLLQNLKPQIANALKQWRWEPSSERLEQVRLKYKQLSRSGAVRDSSTLLAQTQPPTNEVVQKNDHFKKQKERLRRQLNNRSTNESTQAESAKLRPKGFQVISFEALLTNLYHHWLAESLPATWDQLEEQLIEDRLQRKKAEIGEKAYERLSKFGVLQELQFANKEHLNNMVTPLFTLPYPWQRDVREELEELLRDPFLSQLPTLMQPLAGRLLDEKILLSAQKHQAFLLHQDIQAAISMQIAIEKKLPSSGTVAEAEEAQNKWNRTGPLVQQYDFQVLPIQKGQSIPFPGIAFEPNQAGISPVSEPEIERLIHFLRKNPEFVVEIGVYSYGDLMHSTALELSAQRADLLARFIADRGISPDRLIQKGYGKKENVAFKYDWRNNIVVIKLIE